MLERARAGGLELEAAPDGPQRWVRGSVQVEGAELRVQVNSRGRMERLLALLAELGHSARVAEERVSDVAEKLSRRKDETPDALEPPRAGPVWVGVPGDEPIRRATG